VAAVRLARHGAWRLARRGDAAVVPAATVQRDLREVRRLHEQGWSATSRPGGLVDSLRHLPDPAADPEAPR